MNGDKGNISDLISRLKVELKQDKKKTTMLVILLVVGGIVGGRLVISHSLPGKASASGSGGGTGFKPVLQVGKSDRQTQQARLPTGGGQVDFASMDRTINRDLFWPNTKYFPSADKGDTHPAAGQSDQAEQLAEAKQREQRKRLEHAKAIREQAKTLCLTSTMLGRSPTALINGQVLRTGEMINGFRLKSIAPDCCVVTRENVEVKLQMKE